MQFSRAEWLLVALVFVLSVAANLPAELGLPVSVPAAALQIILVALLVFAMVRYVALSIVVSVSMLLVGAGVPWSLAEHFQLGQWAFIAIIVLMLLLSLGRQMFNWSDEEIGSNGGKSHSVRTLFRVVEQGNLAWTYRLLAMGADINVRDEAGQTPLMCAAAKGYADMVQVLIQNGANPALENNRGESAMTIALMKGYTRIAESLKIAEAAYTQERREEQGRA